jgi:hypothetical protein
LIFVKDDQTLAAFVAETESWQFPSDGGRSESLVWRRVANEEDMRKIGCAKETSDREKNKARRYSGFRTSIARTLRQLCTSRGHTFKVEHAPKEGDWHVHLILVQADGITLSKNDKAEIRAKVQNAFGDLTAQSCE